jgi:hypothetical protein
MACESGEVEALKARIRDLEEMLRNAKPLAREAIEKMEAEVVSTNPYRYDVSFLSISWLVCQLRIDRRDQMIA